MTVMRRVLTCVHDVVDVFEVDLGAANGVPRFPGDAQDDQCDHEADDRVGDLRAERDDDRARNNAEGDEAVDAGVLAVGDHRGARESPSSAEPYPGGKLVAGEADGARSSKHPEVGQVLRVDETLHRLVERDAGGDENRKHDRETGEPLAADAAQQEGDAQRHRRQCVAEVVNQVREQGDGMREREDRDLRARSDREDQQAERDGLDPCTGTEQRAVDEPVRVPVPVLLVLVLVLVLVSAGAERLNA